MYIYDTYSLSLSLSLSLSFSLSADGLWTDIYTCSKYCVCMIIVFIKYFSFLFLFFFFVKKLKAVSTTRIFFSLQLVLGRIYIYIYACSNIFLLTNFQEYHWFQVNTWKPCIFNTRSVVFNARLVVELSPFFLSKQRWWHIWITSLTYTHHKNYIFISLIQLNPSFKRYQ